MASLRAFMRLSRTLLAFTRPLSTTTARCVDTNDRGNDTAEKYRQSQKEKPLNPHMTSTSSTIANGFPSVGKDKPPPELITSVNPNFTPKDSVPENTERMTGGTQKPGPDSGPNADLDVGEIEGGTFKVEPLRRTGEDANTMRARLLYQSRKRGTLESDLLLSTFADVHLPTMTPHQLREYDLFLDENDWDIYYWTTQEPTPTSMEYAEGAGADLASPVATGKNPQGKAPIETAEWTRPPVQGEWAQTVGAFKPAYRPVPRRWQNSQILSLLRKHVKERSAGGVHEGTAEVGGKGLNQSVRGTGGGGLGKMPDIKPFN